MIKSRVTFISVETSGNLHIVNQYTQEFEMESERESTESNSILEEDYALSDSYNKRFLFWSKRSHYLENVELFRNETAKHRKKETELENHGVGQALSAFNINSLDNCVCNIQCTMFFYFFLFFFNFFFKSIIYLLLSLLTVHHE